MTQAARKTNFLALPGSKLPDAELKKRVIVVAASAGGTEALKIFFSQFPVRSPGAVVVLHMLSGFTKKYAKVLSQHTALQVKEARPFDPVLPGQILLAPGDYHIELALNPGQKNFHVVLHQKEPLHGVRPSADYLFQSAARVAGKLACGAVLTGMGRDGAAGLGELRKAGAVCFAQDKGTSVVFGMPKAAVEAKAVDHVLPLGAMARAILRNFG